MKDFFRINPAYFDMADAASRTCCAMRHGAASWRVGLSRGLRRPGRTEEASGATSSLATAPTPSPGALRVKP